MTNVTVKVRLYPNSHMKKVLDDLCSYRRYCWNQALDLWNEMYDESIITGNKEARPNGFKVRKILTKNKQDWQYQYSSRVMLFAVKDLSDAWEHFFRKDQNQWGRPKFKSKKFYKQGFKTERAKVVNNKLRLDKPRELDYPWYDIHMKGYRNFQGELKLTSITRKFNKYYASLAIDTSDIKAKKATGKTTAVDVNVGHFNYTDGVVSVLPKKLSKYYKHLKYYQKMLARKKVASHNYKITKAKLYKYYDKVTNLQNDILHKFTHTLVTNYDKIVIENLDVKHMQMSHVASKGMQRAQFGKFREYLTYKCNWYGKKLILADRKYPSTQRCSECGFIKTGDDRITLKGNLKHHTKHNEYICYNCGAVLDRDTNAVNNLLALAE